MPNDPELRQQIVQQHHNLKMAGHLGCWKTLKLVLCNYWWPQMSCYIGAYTSTCDMCLRTKPSHQVPMSELHPLPIPKERWSIVSVDFISELLDVRGYYAVMVVVDSIGKRGHFIPTTITGCCQPVPQKCREVAWPLQCICVRWRSLVCCSIHQRTVPPARNQASSTVYHP